MSEPGRDHVGVGVGAYVLNGRQEVFLALRGPEARNESGCWEFPGGTVEFGETLEAAVRREMREEYGMDVTVERLLGVDDHMTEGQHWVSVSFLARHEGGTPEIREPGKCTAIGWFGEDELPQPLSLASEATLRARRA
ncbi:NUDIX domain-containing protein [Symbioplanes lichenis]|uniref:NUDIX domain-containing protein n=1 Tax=Symbioplanes lichenis TaxID=1629072 RepID=UPI002739F3D7|nr:NUDIX domain-containing protein [Actinoplanes lichenis]